MKFNIQVVIDIEAQEPGLLLQVLEPENQTMIDGTISCTEMAKMVRTEIVAFTKVSTILSTIDDILKTAILSGKVLETTND